MASPQQAAESRNIKDNNQQQLDIERQRKEQGLQKLTVWLSTDAQADLEWLISHHKHKHRTASRDDAISSVLGRALHYLVKTGKK